MILTLLCGGILSAGGAYYESQRRSMQAQIESQLSAIADLKVQQIRAWREERIADAVLLADDPLVAAPPSAQSQYRLQNWMEAFRKLYGYNEVSILNSAAMAVNAASDYDRPIDGETARLVDRALRTGSVAVSDLHESIGDIVIDFVAPVPASSGGSSSRVILLRADASAFLYALVQSWPTQSTTAECLLVRREGQSVRYLNEQRFGKNATLQLTLPWRADLPAGMALRGVEGVRQGSDYRGVAVLAALRRVPETSWALVAKVDAVEIYSPLRQRSRLIALVVALLLAACLATFGFFWHLQQSRFYRRQHQADLERGVVAERCAHLSSCMNDIILLIGPDDRIAQANDRAASAYGRSLTELNGLPLVELVHPSQWPNMEQRAKQTLASGSLLFESVHRRRDGSPFPVEVSSRTVDMDGRRFRQSIIRDITERKQAERELRRTVRAMQGLSASN